MYSYLDVDISLRFQCGLCFYKKMIIYFYSSIAYSMINFVLMFQDDSKFTAI